MAYVMFSEVLFVICNMKFASLQIVSELQYFGRTIRNKTYIHIQFKRTFKCLLAFSK